MLMRRTENGHCPYCGSSLRYGVKEEPASWKIYFECVNPDCAREFSVGYISRSEIDHLDEVYERAEKFYTRI